jgi:bifunctional non-homologous end joining protein LigD
MLPHVRNRPLTLLRCPDGCHRPCFFQKHQPKGAPDGVHSVAMREAEGKRPYSVIDDAKGLFGLLQLATLEIHTWGSRADDFEHPDVLVFDLDPDPELDFEHVIGCALRLRELFEAAELESFVKTTGGKGLHVCVPIEPDLSFEVVKDFTSRVADALAGQVPSKYVSTPSLKRRKGKIYIDTLRNARGASCIAPYSTRARPNASIAMPLEWAELTSNLRPDQFTVRNVAERLATIRRDPFERMAQVKQRLR